MKRFVLIPVMASILSLSACSGTNDTDVCGTVTTTAPASETAAVQAYLSSKGITATADNRGFFYSIKNAGSTARPTVCSNVQVNYTGRLTDGTPFDANTQVIFPLRNLILGWKEGIPLIGEGGSITLYLPPSLGYGNVAQEKIPANSILIFDIDLLQFN